MVYCLNLKYCRGSENMKQENAVPMTSADSDLLTCTESL